VLLPAAWVSVELVRVNFPFGGFGWFVLGHTQGAWRALTQVGTWSQVASLGGEHAVSWLLAMASGLAVDAMGLRATKLGRCAGSGVRWRWVATLAAVSVWLTLAWGWGLADRELHEARRLTVAAVQTDIVNDNSVALTHEDEQARWRALLELTVGLGQGRDTTATDSIRGLGVGASGSEGSGVDLIVWPESMVPGPVNEAVRAMGAADDPWGYWESRHYHRQLVELAERVGVPIVVGGNAYGGAVEVERDGAVGLLPTGRTNAAYVYAPGVGQVRGTGAEGGRVDRYDKQHLVVAGETIPGGEMWPWWRAWVVGWISPWGYDFTLDAGAGPVVFDVTAGRGAVRLATPICYEVASPAVVRDMVTGSEPWRVAPVGGTSKRVDLLTNLTNNGWYTGASMRRQMVQIATFRAIEHRVPVVMACNTGVSAVIDATGRVVAELPAGREGVLVAEVGLTEATTGYGVAGRWPWWALLWGMLAGSAGLAWQGRGKRRSEAPAPS
jgi:apolipoprotein N-acyltransferase